MIEPSFESIISIENLLEAWKEFLCGKRKRKDVQEFQLHLMDNILCLHYDLKNKQYRHGSYEAFSINDPKPRNIHKASVRDRLLHHTIYRMLYPYFDNKFIFDSYSCRKWKGTHKAINRLRQFGREVSRNNTQHCYILKCDIRKFFASIDQEIMMDVLSRYLSNKDTLRLIQEIIQSFYSTARGKGLPLGNLTSQLLVNIYMNEFDHYVKHILKVKYYIRYADDFLILNQDKNSSAQLLLNIQQFLKHQLRLELHPNKIFITTLSSGVDFLGWINFFDYRVLRTSTKKRMFKNLEEAQKSKTIHSYLGLLTHGNTQRLKKKIVTAYKNKTHK